ncbi:hypothetical protein NB688_001995 [Xanthomonas sacchari]|uniref:DUF1453 domain-containing protein n=1 Tax=Xanthomonas sacchari TaxID=56458 RepID=A0ABT3DWL2_9XANT|nr:hypothetical protein [Xanthomonas sacchari]MCW0399370.1 hypothetical protein [Xanthomonas sacchari]MCW0419829.1 hypothetical protein [Xanthomonas sacchari]UYK73255.1 hypothetical protein NG828_02640 [Xanthomonas sacchari]
MAANGIALLTPYLATAGVGWLYYRRIRRYFGRQPWQPRRTGVRLGFLLLVAVLLTWLAVQLPAVRLGMALGAVGGAALGGFALHHTHIELQDGARWYTPNPWIGAALSVLLLGRLAWRWASGAFAGGSAETLQNASPLTMSIAAALIAYGLVYAAGLLVRMRSLTPAA